MKGRFVRTLRTPSSYASYLNFTYLSTMNNVYILGTLLCLYGFTTGWGCYIILLWVCSIIAFSFCYCFSGGLCQGVYFCCLDWPWTVCCWNQHSINAVTSVLHCILSGYFTYVFYYWCSWVHSICCRCFCIFAYSGGWCQDVQILSFIFCF